ncbi:uncharacterized protein batf2 [Cottoperca gobio]|uniref:Uncharacterized protein batf2 n=1 Tax=Cottoperca gobio TaxID=56716 RepID=A0A6J2RLK7_COTGO|nr:uncharacterized protein LOC115023411 [Cottoperca gobio]
MSPLFMEIGSELNSLGSVSAEESNTAGSEREGEGEQVGNRRTKRNRDAARKSRKKQTERADELHEELQCLERSNSSLKKEIAALKKDLHLHTSALERHTPCFLKDFASSPPGAPPRTSSSTFAATSLSTSRVVLQTRDCVETVTCSPPPAPTTATLASPGGSTEVFSSSSSVTALHSACFSAVPAPHSLFSEDPPSLITSRANVPPVCTSLVSNPVPCSSLPAAAQPQSGQRHIHESSSLSANACFSPLDAFLMKQASFLTASSKVEPPYSYLVAKNAGLVAQGGPMNVQLHPGQLSRNSRPTLQDPAPQSLPASPPALDLALKPNYSRQVEFNSASLLSLLTVPSPLYVPQTTTSSFDGPLPQTPPSLPRGDPSRDLSLSEFLEFNDWILGGTSH